MRKLWLIFAQSATVALAVLLVVSTMKPELISWRGNTITIKEVAPSGKASVTASYSEAASKSMAAVVNIFTSKEIQTPRHPLINDPVFRRFFGDPEDTAPQRVSSLGSGVIVSAQGFILTNHHVVEAADEIQVALADGRNVPAHIVGTDPDTDLAVLKIDLKNLPSITFGRSDQARVGDVALAIGNPFGVGQTVTMGIISALGRSHLGINTIENFIQTDAAINPGNSGGALVDANGNLLGINSAIYSRSGGSQGIGFAIPASLAKQIMEQIINHGAVIRGWIGVEVQDITPELATSFKLPKTAGSLIAGVLRNGPADRAGIIPGDILLEVENKPVVDSADMLNKISALVPGKLASLKILRNQTEVILRANIGKRPVTQQRPLPEQEN